MLINFGFLWERTKMKQMFFNFGVGVFCFPVLMLITETIDKVDIRLSVDGIWIGFCLACLINGFICLVKE